MRAFDVTANELRSYLDNMEPLLLASDGKGTRIQYRVGTGNHEVTVGTEIRLVTPDAAAAASVYNQLYIL